MKEELDSVTSTELAKAAYEGYLYGLKQEQDPIRCIDFMTLPERVQKLWYYAAANVKDLLSK